MLSEWWCEGTVKFHQIPHRLYAGGMRVWELQSSQPFPVRPHRLHAGGTRVWILREGL